MITNAQIKEYQALHKARYGEDISYEQALADGTRLIQLIHAVYDKDYSGDIELPYEAD